MKKNQKRVESTKYIKSRKEYIIKADGEALGKEMELVDRSDGRN